MTLDPGTRLGDYEITAPLGAGGMGEVYRASDTKLGREVAIKVLPEELGQDAERVARFEKEARSLAALSHPNVATLYGFARDGDVHFLAMELAPGEDLAERIARGPLPVDEAIEIFQQIAEGLEAAHARGIVHRDLKPANVKVDDEGRVKILDFGLAKATEAEPVAEASASLSPTLTAAATMQGQILGTAAYMSPEQARGKTVDARTDVWAFGACLFEALTGRRAFEGDEVPMILSAVLQNEPDWDALPAATPPSVHRLLRRCLEKKPSQRLHHIADARLELEAAAEEGVAGTITATPPRSSPAGLAAVALLSLVLGALGMWTASRRGDGDRPTATPSREIVTLLDREIELAGGIYAIAIAPDARSVVFAGRGPLGHRLYIRRLGSRELEPIDRTENARNPAFSPDGRWIAFTSDGALYKMELGADRPTSLASVGNPRGVTWSADGEILFGTVGDNLFRVDAETGAKERLEIDGVDEERRLQSPERAGREGLYFTSAGTAREDVRIVALASPGGEPEVIAQGTTPRYAAGHLFFARGASLYAAPVDPVTLLPREDPELVLEGIRLARNRYAQFDVARDGTVAFFTAGAEVQFGLQMVDRQGRGKALELPDGTSWLGPRVSNDGTRIAASVRLGGEQADMTSGAVRGIWIYDLERETPQRLTFDDAVDFNPVWTATDEHVVFASVRDAAGFRLFRRATDGSGSVEALGAEKPNGIGYSLAPDGSLVYTTVGEGTNVDIHAWSEGADPPSRPLVEGPSYDGHPEVSPDGRWLMHTFGTRLWVRPYPDVDEATWELPLENRGGGIAGPLGATWSRQTQEIFVVADNRMWSYPYSVTEGRFVLEAGQVLFDLTFPDQSGSRQWDAMPDGQHFILPLAKPLSTQTSPGSTTEVDRTRIDLARGLVPIQD